MWLYQGECISKNMDSFTSAMYEMLGESAAFYGKCVSCGMMQNNVFAEVIQKVYLTLTTAKKNKSNMTLFIIILQVQFK